MKRILLLSIVVLALLAGCIGPECTTNDDCSLNLCGCVCENALIPETALCGTDCLAGLGITGCQCVDNKCEPVVDETLTTRCSFDDDCPEGEYCAPWSWCVAGEPPHE